ncbi:Hypothetical protein KVN_LOCUS226 [uncultured virus]|nr:Hypothetical protein KVN_LOCUS226 [uncultured virus]
MTQNEINNYLTDYKKDDLSGIIHDSFQPYFQNYHKINIYNSNISIPLQKIWIKTPKLKVYKNSFISNVQKKQSIPLYVSLNSGDIDSKKLLNFIKKIENKVNNFISKILTKKIFMRSSIKNNSLPGIPPQFILQMPYKKNNNNYEFLFHIYNCKNNKINIDSIKSGSFVSSFIELSDVWIKDNEFGFNWNILQLKVYPNFDFTKCLFMDEITDTMEPEDTIDISNLPLPPPPPPVSLFLNDNKNIKKQDPKLLVSNFVAPTVEQLLSIKLKPINKDNIIEESNPKKLLKKKSKKKKIKPIE